MRDVIWENKKPCLIIAEAGVNHNGRLDLALRLVRKASEAGADAVKFQTFRANQVVTDRGKMASYQIKNTGEEKSQKEMISEFELNEEWYPRIIAECKKYGIIFMSTPHGGRESVRFLNKYVSRWKIGSGDLLNFILLDEISKTKKSVILSSGMHDLKEIFLAIKFLLKKGYKRNMISVLHCTTNYPCMPEQVNLSAMVTMMKKLKGITIGYSDHTVGPKVAVMAITLGAKIYECHFTLDKTLPGPDHKASAEPNELKEKIDMIRKSQIIMGCEKKKPIEIETKEMKLMVTRSIVAARDFAKGSILKTDDLEAKRPGDGVSPKYYEKFIGKRLKRDILYDEQITFKDIE